MSLSREEVTHIALLARLELSEEEKGLYQQQLSTILDYVAQLQKLDTSRIQSTSSMLLPNSRLREDKPRAGLSIEEALSNAPHVENRQFRVPHILE